MQRGRVRIMRKKTMTPTQRHVICNKETDIALIKQDMNYVKEKLDDLHVKLAGNGKPGLFSEIERVKGGMVTIKIMGAIITFLIGVAIFYFNHLKR